MRELFKQTIMLSKIIETPPPVHLTETAYAVMTKMFYGLRPRDLVVHTGLLLSRSFDPQSGNEKNHRRAQFNRSALAKQKATKAYLSNKYKRLGPSDFVAQHPNLEGFLPDFKTYKPHSGIDLQTICSQLKNLSSLQGLNISEIVFSRIEGISLLLAALAECNSQTQAFSIFLLYMKSHFSESLLSVAAKAFEEIFEMPNAYGVVEPQSGTEQPEWLKALRNTTTSWKMVVTNPVFKKVSYLISMCISLGLCDAANFRWDVQGVRLFSIPAADRHSSALDLADAAIETVVFFVEGGYECFQEKSFSPFLYHDQRARKLESEFGFLQANLEHIKCGNLKKITNVSVNEYDLRLQTTIQEASEMHYCADGAWEKKILFDRLTVLRKIKTTFDSIRVEGGLRVAPFTVNFFGPTGVGKSTLCAITMVTCLKSNGFPADDNMIVYLSSSDKFFSNFRTYTTGVFLDDHANTKPDYVDKAPTQTIVELCNNARSSAPMAEADMKGKCGVEPKAVIISTNLKNLAATEYTRDPASIARRAHLTVTVAVKSQFCTRTFKGAVNQQLDSELVRLYYTDDRGVCNVPVIPDLWDLHVERVVPFKAAGCENASEIGYETYEHNGRPLKDISFGDFLNFMCDVSREHFVNQDLLVERSNNLNEKIELCSCGYVKNICGCVDPVVVDDSDVPELEENPIFVPPPEIDPHVGMVLGAALGCVVNHQVAKVTDSVTRIFEKETSVIEKMCTDKLLSFTKGFEFSYFWWTSCIPRQWLQHEYGKKFILYALRDEVIYTVKRDVFLNLFFCLLCFMYGLYVPIVFPFCICIILYRLYRIAIIVETVKERLYDEIKERSDVLPEVFKSVRETKAKYVLAALGTFGILYTLLRVWRGFRLATTTPHGDLDPTSQSDIDERDSEENVWAGVNIAPLTVTPVQKTTTVDQLTATVFKNQVFLVVDQKPYPRTSGAVFIGSNVMIMPYHMFYPNGDMTLTQDSNLRVNVQRGERGSVGCGFKAILSFSQAVRIPDTDLCLVWVPSGGDWRNITKWFPTGAIRNGPVKMVHKNSLGQREDAHAAINVRRVGHKYLNFDGATYDLSIPTRSGMCMATMISCGVGPHIVGFHLGGVTNKHHGVLGTITQGQITTALAILGDAEGVILSTSSGDIPTHMYDTRFFESPTVHTKSPVNFLPDTANIAVFGSVIGRTSPHSGVAPTIISDLVTEVCGVPQQWGKPPLLPAWKPWERSLAYASNPSCGFDGDAMAFAVQDYSAPLLQLIANNQYVRNSITPLTDMQTVCGIDGRRFIDKMPTNTSVGFPLTGPKSDYLTKLEPVDFPGFEYPQELDPKFWEEAEHCEALFLEGTRAYPIFKGSIKDEPTLLTKDKARVFQCAPMALQLLIRKYFLPVARFISLHPLKSECAVGINCQGPEWDQLQKHITQFGKDRILAGDYSKYDLRMPAQVSMASLRVMMSLAEASGNYTQRDLTVMSGIATEICYPMTAFNGTLIQFNGTNPSGHNVTVYVNSIGNSLQLRCAYFDIVKPKPGETFRKACAATTYGDDVKSSVNRKYPGYNHITVAKFFKKHDVIFTMPDKTSTPTEYMDDADCEFLKRRSVYNAEVNMSFGALDEMSIFKSLHSAVRSKVLSPTEQAVSNIDGALQEWFAHGEDVYELRRAQMIQISDRAGFTCRETSTPYAIRLAEWKEKYLPPEE
jgi:hypothetical protein